MILISDEFIDEVYIRYYNGIDFNEIMNHPNDGSGGFIICFIDNWSSEVKRYIRNCNIDNIINKTDIDCNVELNNNYISIYQTSGIDIYESIREKIKNNIKTSGNTYGF